MINSFNAVYNIFDIHSLTMCEDLYSVNIISKFFPVDLLVMRMMMKEDQEEGQKIWKGLLHGALSN